MSLSIKLQVNTGVFLDLSSLNVFVMESPVAGREYCSQVISFFYQDHISRNLDLRKPLIFNVKFPSLGIFSNQETKMY